MDFKTASFLNIERLALWYLFVSVPVWVLPMFSSGKGRLIAELGRKGLQNDGRWAGLSDMLRPL